MDLNKKRVSFSHIAVPMHLRTISESSGSTCSSSVHSGKLNPSGLNENKPGPPSFKTVETFHISLDHNGESSSSDQHVPNSNVNSHETSVEASSNVLKFQETRRRSHAFSVSAIDETLPVNMDGEYYEDIDESVDGHNVANSSASSVTNKPKGVKMFRAAEIPLGSRNRILICQTKHEFINNKSFQHEIRAIRDLDWFLARPNVLLDCECTNVEMIIEQMLEVFHKALPEDVLNEARAELYSANNAAFYLSNVIQNVLLTEDGQYLHDPSWFCTYASVSQLKTRRVVIARLKRPTNFGPTLRAVQFVILVLVPTVEKLSKSAFEIARTFSTLFSEAPLRIALLTAADEDRFSVILEQRVANIKSYKNIFKANLPEEYGHVGVGGGESGGGNRGFEKGHSDDEEEEVKPRFRCSFGRGLVENFTRRIKYYPSDFIDGLTGEKTWLKVPAATLSLFFTCLLPCVAFGVVNQQNTNFAIGPKEALLGQAIGGLFFALFSGQPLVIIATTAPLCLYTQIVYRISISIGVEFYDFFAAVGLWNGFFVLLYALFDLSHLMRFCTRSTEEIFSTFIFFAFAVDAFTQCADSFSNYYCFDSAAAKNFSEVVNGTLDNACSPSPEKPILFLFLMLGTVALALLLFNFSSTPYLNSLLRETLADYALPLSVIVFSLIGSVAFSAVQLDKFDVNTEIKWRIATLSSLNVSAILLSLLLGFALSILFFIDQNVSAALVSAPSNRLQKGDAYHLDLLVVAILNVFLSFAGLPWMHGILPHSPMHARALADVLPLTDAHNSGSINGFVVLRIRETRVTGLLIHILIALVAVWPSLLNFIPVAVLSGLLLYCAVSTLRNNSLYERFLLLITEQTSYPPTHYLRYCPQRFVHLFTGAQVLQLAVVCFFGFAPWEYVQLAFPFIIGLLIPIRWLILPRFTEPKYLTIIDSKHC